MRPPRPNPSETGSAAALPPGSAPPPSGDAACALLRHFPAEVGRAFLRFRATGSAEDAAIVVRAVIRDHLPDRPAAAAADLAPERTLVGDLGFDSMAMTEMVFFFEDLFAVAIGNEEILGVRTVGDLCALVAARRATLGPAGE